MLPTTLIP